MEQVILHRNLEEVLYRKKVLLIITVLLGLFMTAAGSCRRFDPPRAQISAERSIYELGLGLNADEAGENAMRSIETPFSYRKKMYEQKQDESDISKLVLPQKVNVLEGKINMAIINGEDYSPFNVRDEYDKSINNLLYRSLFKYNLEGHLVPDLVDHISYSNDNTVIEISINDLAYYENNIAVSPSDVKACIDKIKSLKSDDKTAIYKDNLSSIERCEVIDSYGLRLFLNKPDPYIAHALTFPVISVNDVDKLGIGNFLSSTDFSRSENRASVSYVKNQKSENRKNTYISEINIENFKNSNQVKNAFENGDIDIYFDYTGKQDLIKKPHFVYANNTSIILRANVNSISSKDIHIIREVYSDIYNDFHIFRKYDPALIPQGYPFIQKSIPSDIFPESANYRVRRKPGTGVSELEKKELTLIYSENLLFADDISSSLEKLTQSISSRLRTERLSELEYQKRVEANDYDLLLCSSDLPSLPDLGFFMNESERGDNWRSKVSPLTFDISFLDEEKLDEDYTYWSNYLLPFEQYSPLLDENNKDKYMGFFQNLDFMTIANYSCAVYLSDNIRGNLSSNTFNPLEGFENLWIGSTD